ncbi:RxLR-like protein [Plasmopara halstedii]|uniref:RxLR-like protein n=1 Tax=Plasmopara halstedii TaxID=4781 RepID=A0A0N7L4N3_PLAHL|nr:RxLR-like protein [Plasmopara halstedii]CEG39155.1 RxLR-like protein [Plasmopara halstedii]|eukprot:XP_024575524.1 RxLR-like protein [Plasmopara halstedii]
MKIFITLAAAFLAVTQVNINADHISRNLILGGDIIPKGTKTYTCGIRATPENDNHCAGVLVTSMIVMTSAICTSIQEDLKPNYVAVGNHYINGTEDGEVIKVIKAQNHTLLDIMIPAYDYGFLILEKPSKFPPIELATEADIEFAMLTKVMGWGLTNHPDVPETSDGFETSYELRGVDVQVWKNEDCAVCFNGAIDPTDVCFGGHPNKTFSYGDFGGPLIKETPEKDLLVGVATYTSGGVAGMPSIASRASAAAAFINELSASLTPGPLSS